MKKKYCNFFLIFLLVSLHTAYGQNFSYTNVSVKSVSFKNSLTIYKDDNSGAYTAPQWNAATAAQSPVAYVSGNKPTVSASFTMSCSNAPGFVLVRGSGPDSIRFASQKVAVTASSTSVHTFLYPDQGGSKVFPGGVVRFFNPFSIDWEISFDDGASWRKIGTTSNTLYVTRSTPNNSTSEFQWYHTVFDLSCRNAQNQTTETGIISSVWKEFTDQVVLNHKGDSLYYYKLWNAAGSTLGALLKYRDGQCFTFVQLFLAALKIQGITRSNNYINITSNYKSACNGKSINIFFVKSWSFGTPSATNECADFPYKNTYTSLWNSNNTGYAFVTADVTDQKGVPGSCTSNPPSLFLNHQIAKIDGKYYDPSYGGVYNSLDELETAALAGWSILTYQNGYSNLLITKDLSKADLMENTIKTY